MSEITPERHLSEATKAWLAAEKAARDPIDVALDNVDEAFLDLFDRLRRETNDPVGLVGIISNSFELLRIIVDYALTLLDEAEGVTR